MVVVALLLMLPLDHRHFWYHLLLMIWLLLPMIMQQFGYTVQHEVYVGGYTIVMYVFHTVMANNIYIIILYKSNILIVFTSCLCGKLFI